jgi:predicted RNA binding protein YcfA (HicA-like mRNA interferase family)
VTGKKLLEKARANSASLSFNELEALMKASGWSFHRQKGSHRLWYSPTGFRLPVQARGHDAKGYQVRQFLVQYDKENPHG